MHVALVVWMAACSLAAWWQVTVALGGDRLGYVYAVEWPCFAIFGAVVWWHQLHDDPSAVGARALRGAATEDAAGSELDVARIRDLEHDDPGLARYNEYLEDLSGRPQPQGWRRP